MRFIINLKRLFIVLVRDRLVARRSLKNLYSVLGGHIYFELLYSAIELDLFTLLDKRGPLEIKEIAREIGLEEFPCRIMLLGLVSTGLLNKSGGKFRNTFVGERALVSTSPLYIGNCVRWQHHIVYKPMFHMLESLKQNRHVGLQEFPGPGNSLYERLSAYPKEETIFQDAMSEISDQANKSLAEYFNFAKSQKVVDVGGGAGTNIVSICKANPHLKGAVFDLPSICEKARSNFSRSGLDARLTAIPGNCFTDKFPAADAFMFCHFMCIWSAAENISLLKKAYEALPQGGRVLIFDIMQNDDQRGPLAAAMGSPYFLGLATGRGMIYSISEYEEFCRQAGFKNVNRISFPAEHTVVVASK